MPTSPSYPPSFSPELVGTWPLLAKSGGGLCYDVVLEYRCWGRDESGSHCTAFPTHELAVAHQQKNPQEVIMVLVRQSEWVEEGEDGVRKHCRGTRLAEWRPEWLADNKRDGSTIARLLGKAA